MRLRGALVVLVLLTAACRSDSPVPDWENAGAPTLSVSIAETATTCGKCLSLREIVRIAPDSGPGMVDESHYVSIDSMGRLIVSRASGHQVYEANGLYSRTIGRQGSGPLEFTLPGPVTVDAKGNIHFFDPALNRESVIDRHYDLIRERSLRLGVVYDAIAVGDGHTRFVNALSMEPVKIGNTIHRVDDDSVTVSFGEPDDSTFAPASVALQRQLAMHPSGNLVSGRRFEYVIEIFSPTGERRLLARRGGVWPQTSGEPDPIKRGAKLNGYLQDIEVDSLGSVWVLSMDPRSDWERFAKNAALPNGMSVLMPIPDSPPWFRSRLEVLDLRTGTVLASRVFDDQLWGFLGATRLYGYTYGTQSEPQLVVYSVNFAPKP